MDYGHRLLFPPAYHVEKTKPVAIGIYQPRDFLEIARRYRYI
jgi:hypothetical protein